MGRHVRTGQPNPFIRELSGANENTRLSDHLVHTPQ